MIKKNLRKIVLKLRGNDSSKEFCEIQNINNTEELLEFQNRYLKNLILHAYKNVPYYHEIFKRINIVSGDKVDLAKFEHIPILTKEIIRKNSKELISTDHTTRKWFYNSSGGSTGEPIKHMQDDSYARWATAAKDYYYQNILGIDESNVKKILLWGSERDLYQQIIGFNAKLSNWLSNTILLNSFKMTENDITHYIQVINTFKPELIRGYTISLLGLCEYAKRNNLPLHTPKILISTAETLTKDMRQKIEDAFGTKLYNLYGSREVGVLAGECKKDLMHILLFNNFIEIVDRKNQPTKEGETGTLLITNLHNYSMPLFRYEIGDMAVGGPKKCQCHDILPTLNKIAGRITDHFLRKDGTIVPAEFFIHLIGVVCNTGSIEKFQVIQEDYQRLKILVVPKGTLTESDKKDIENKIQITMKNDCKILWELVDDIPNTKSGKYQYTKSLLWR